MLCFVSNIVDSKAHIVVLVVIQVCTIIIMLDLLDPPLIPVPTMCIVIEE